MKSNKGITLVALVITIIVLLILAGVSISLVVGDNGVLTQAQSASKKTDVAGVDTAMQTALAGVQTEFMGNVWADNVNSKIYTWLTYEKIDNELSNLGYRLVTGYGAAKGYLTASTSPKSTDTMGAAGEKTYYIADKNATNATDTVYRIKATFTDTGVSISEHAKITTGASTVED